METIAHERNSIFKCKQTVNGPWGPEKNDYTMMKCHEMPAYLGAVFALSAMKCPPTWVLCLP